MYLEGQAAERGYAMAALLVSLAVMSVLMSVALPTWRHAAQREKEAELVFRGEQYARAVALFRAKNGNAFPPSVDVLVQGKYLRKKYLDPITGKEFDVIGASLQSQPQRGGGGGREGGVSGIPAVGAPSATGSVSETQLPSAFGGTPVSGGIAGVRSKSQETSIRTYQGQSQYNLWSFLFSVTNRPGSAVPGAANPGGRGGDPMGGRGGPDTPGGRGTRGIGPTGPGQLGPGTRGGSGLQPGGPGPGRGRAGA